MIPDGREGEPLVTVVIPTRNRRDRVRLTLQSALAQQDVGFEIVVVDDASEDGTANMINELADPRIHLVRNEAPMGESGARNGGLHQARGRWVAFLDDDDLWAPAKLARQLCVLRETGRHWAYVGYVAVDPQLRILYGAPPPQPETVMRLLRRYNSVPGSGSSVIVDSQLLSRVGPFDTTLQRTADWDMWLRLGAVAQPAAVSEPLVGLCIHPGNTSRDMRRLFGELDILAARHGIRVDRARHYRWAAWGALAAGRRGQALGYYSRALAAGDIRSAGRAVLALLGSRTTSQTPPTDNWAQQARRWLDALPRPG